MQGTWEDFTSKYGFGDGEQWNEWDCEARKELVRLLNRTKVLKEKGLRAFEFDRPGIHNALLIIFLEKGRTLADWQKGKCSILEKDPEGIDYDKLVDDAYYNVEKKRKK